MTHEEKWMARYNEVMEFIMNNKRRPSKYNPEERNAKISGSNGLLFSKEKGGPLLVKREPVK